MTQEAAKVDNNWYYWAATWVYVALLVSSPFFFAKYSNLILLIGWSFLATYSFFAWCKEKYRNARRDFMVAAGLVILQTVKMIGRYALPQGQRAAVDLMSFAGLLVLIALHFWIDRYKTWLELSDYDLLFIYKDASRKWGRAETKEEWDEAYRTVWRVYYIMKKRGVVKDLLSPLLSNGDDGIKTLAARQLLTTMSTESLEALDEVSKHDNDIAHWAKECADEWRSGDLEVDKDLPPEAWEYLERAKADNRVTRRISRRVAELWKSFWKDNHDELP